MERKIVGFGYDEVDDPIAWLSCGHPQHIRHNPPLERREWVLTESGRQAKVGEALDCVRCDNFEMPAQFVPIQKTPVFTESSMPAALRRDHFTKAGIWAKINVVEGELRYQVAALNAGMILTPRQPGVVIAEIPHSVEPLGAARFYVEFYAEPDDK